MLCIAHNPHKTITDRTKTDSEIYSRFLKATHHLQIPTNPFVESNSYFTCLFYLVNFLT